MASFTATVRSNTRVARFRSTRLVSTFARGGQRAWSSGNFTTRGVSFFFFFFGCSMRICVLLDDENVWSNRFSQNVPRTAFVRERRRSERSTRSLTRISLLRPPNSRSSRLSPANSRTASSLRYAFSRSRFSIVLCAFSRKGHTDKRW